MATVRSTPCVHGKPAICRFIDKNGYGCRFGEACHYCHICRRVTTYDRIQRAISSRRGSAVDAAGAANSGAVLSGHSCSSRNLAFPLLRLLSSCPELILEGSLGQALPLDALFILSCVHPSISSLMVGGAALIFWRMQLRQLFSAGLQLAADVFLRLTVNELRSYARSLSNLKYKSACQVSNAAELRALAEAADNARDAAPAGSALFVYEYIFLSVDADMDVHSEPLDLFALLANQTTRVARVVDDGYGSGTPGVFDDGYGPVDVELASTSADEQASIAPVINDDEEAGFLRFDDVQDGTDDAAEAIAAEMLMSNVAGTEEETGELGFDTFVPLVGNHQDIAEEQNHGDATPAENLEVFQQAPESSEEEFVNVDDPLDSEEEEEALLQAYEYSEVARDEPRQEDGWREIYTALRPNGSKPVEIELEDGRALSCKLRGLARISSDIPPKVQFMLQPEVYVDRELMRDRKLEIQMHMWSAVPGFDALQGSSKSCVVPVTAADAAALLEADRRLRVVAAVRVSQRFWDLPLR